MNSTQKEAKMKDQEGPMTRIAVFKEKSVRKTIHNNEWWFSIVDVVGALTDSENPRDYWYKMKIREKDESGVELSTFCRQLRLESSDGKKYLTDCANTEGVFRIIQSIPSPKAEPFKRWLARVGYERIQEIEDPELAMKRMRAIYKAKGYSADCTDSPFKGFRVVNTALYRKKAVRYQIPQYFFREFGDGSKSGPAGSRSGKN